MRRFIIPILAVLAMTQTFQSAAATVKADNPDLAYVGRHYVDPEGHVIFTYPGLQLHALFEGEEASLITKPGSGFFMVEIDDKEPFKVESRKGEPVVKLAEGLGGGVHRLTVSYVNEGLIMKPEIHGLDLGEGGHLAGKPQLPERKLEFIGNSITCALGNEGSPADKKHTYDKQNQYYSFEAIAARELDAQCLVVARSGIGLYRNNNGSPKGDKNAMQGIYPYVNFGMTGPKWDFSKYQPDVVCVGLGTNDTTFPSYDTALLTNDYKDFLMTLRGHYPEAKIVLLTGCMLHGQRLEDVVKAQKEAIADANARGDMEVYRFDMSPDDGSLGYGMFKHPSKKRHARMAEELVPFLHKITGWN